MALIEYDVELTSDAEADLAALPVWIQDAAATYLRERLARNLVVESETVSQPRFGRVLGTRATHQVGPITDPPEIIDSDEVDEPTRPDPGQHVHGL